MREKVKQLPLFKIQQGTSPYKILNAYHSTFLVAVVKYHLIDLLISLSFDFIDFSQLYQDLVPHLKLFVSILLWLVRSKG